MAVIPSVWHYEGYKRSGNQHEQPLIFTTCEHAAKVAWAAPLLCVRPPCALQLYLGAKNSVHAGFPKRPMSCSLVECSGKHPSGIVPQQGLTGHHVRVSCF